MGCGGGSGSDDGTSAGDDAGDAGETGGEAEGFDLAPAVLPRLTAVQYRNALVDLFGPELPVTTVEADTNPFLFFSIGATSTTLSELGVQQFEEAADQVAHVVFDDAVRREALVGCAPQSPGDGCVQQFIETFGRRAFRRPLDEPERARWTAVAADLAEGDAWRGVRLAVAGMLQSPHFLYRVEVGEPDPDDPTRLRYTDYEMAGRLSFLLWNSIPDDALLDAAERGDLTTASGLEEQARRLLESPRAGDAVQDFFGQYLDLGRLDGVSRDPQTYPLYVDTLPEAMGTEVRLLVDDLVFRRDEDVRQLFSTRRTFVNARLSSLYGVDAPGASAITFVPVELPDDGPRAGILTLGAFLAMNAHETETSPTLRGKYVRERVLCQEVPPPPDDVDVNLDPGGEGDQTLRERLEEHRANPSCAACHAFIDPPGFLFENFDSVGAYRTTEPNGLPIDASGELDGTPLSNAKDLAAVLADDPRVGPCMVKQLYRHSQGRLEADGEKVALEQLGTAFEAEAYRFSELLVQLVTHDAYRYVASEEVGG